MGDEEQGGPCSRPVAEAPVVKSCDDGLAGSRRCDDEVAVTVMHDAFDVELLEHLGLMGVGADLETGE